MTTTTYYRVRFNQQHPAAPTLHRADCAEAQFSQADKQQKMGFHQSGDPLRSLDALTSLKAYADLEAEYGGKVNKCKCLAGSALMAGKRPP